MRNKIESKEKDDVSGINEKIEKYEQSWKRMLIEKKY